MPEVAFKGKAKIDFGGALGVSLDDQTIKGLKKYFEMKRRFGERYFYYDKHAPNAHLKFVFMERERAKNCIVFAKAKIDSTRL